MKPDKEKVLRGLLGDAKVDSLVTQIEQKEGAAILAGIRTKASEKDTEAEDTELDELLASLDETEEGEADEVEFDEATLAAIGNAFDEAVAPLQSENKELRDVVRTLAVGLKEANARIAEMQVTLKEATDTTPRAEKAKGYRASQADATVTEKAKEAGEPTGDPVSNFLESFGTPVA